MESLTQSNLNNYCDNIENIEERNTIYLFFSQLIGNNNEKFFCCNIKNLDPLFCLHNNKLNTIVTLPNKINENICSCDGQHILPNIIGHVIKNPIKNEYICIFSAKNYYILKSRFIHILLFSKGNSWKSKINNYIKYNCFYECWDFQANDINDINILSKRKNTSKSNRPSKKKKYKINTYIEDKSLFNDNYLEENDEIYISDNIENIKKHNDDNNSKCEKISNYNSSIDYKCEEFKEFFNLDHKYIGKYISKFNIDIKDTPILNMLSLIINDFKMIYPKSKYIEHIMTKNDVLYRFTNILKYIATENDIKKRSYFFAVSFMVLFFKLYYIVKFEDTWEKDNHKLYNRDIVKNIINKYSIST